MKLMVKLPDHFMNKVTMTDSCWLWNGSKAGKGYGKMTVRRKNVYAHRFAWSVYNGQEIPKSMAVCHKCDVPACVNPDHLFLGTNQENHDDMSAKGRSTRGSKSKTAILTEEQVLEIKRTYIPGKTTGPISERKSEFSAAGLARKYGVSRHAIIQIIRGNNWRHL